MYKRKNSEYIIGIDLGTGSTKAVAMNSKGSIIAHSQTYYSVNQPAPAFSELDPEIVWNAFTNCIKKIISLVKYPPLSISLSSAMHGLIVVNKNNKCITPLITWMDMRSASIAEKLRKMPTAESLYQTTGTPIHSMTPLCKIIWLKENDPKIFKAAFKFISIKEWIWFQLFNVYEIDHSIASATGLFNIHNSQWNDYSLKLCGIIQRQLSDLVATDFIRKNINTKIADSLQIRADTMFCIGASDGCLANIGSYAIGEGTAALTIGTSGAVRVANEKPIFNFAEMTFNYVLDEKTFICGGPVNNGGNILTWLFKVFLKNESPSEKDYHDLFETIESIPAGSKGLIFLPYLYGERAPVWDETSSGIFFGIKPFHTNAYFLRAILEGICYSLNQVLEIVSSTKEILQINVGGGFIRSKTWMRMLADITGKKLCIIETEDSSAIGAAILNWKSLKMIEDYSSLEPNDHILIAPDLSNYSLYKKYNSVFKNLYPSLKESMHQAYKIANT